MVTIRYRNFIINGTDMSGKELSMSQEEADKLVRLGYAEIIQGTVRESAQESVLEHTPIGPQETKQPKKRGKRQWL